MALVRVPDRMKEFTSWVKDVTKAAEMKFDRRAKSKSRSSRAGRKRRNRRRKKRQNGSRD